jgi:hypothetical protein
MGEKYYTPLKRGRYTVQELDEAIAREQAWADKCDAEGSSAAQMFKDSVENLKKERALEAEYRRAQK